MQKMNEFFEKVAKDSDLQARYVEIIQDSLKSGEDATYKKLIDFTKEAGYDITIDEMKVYFKSMTASKEGELSDSELDKVAGGLFSDGPRFPFPGGPGHTPMSMYIEENNRCLRW